MGERINNPFEARDETDGDLGEHAVAASTLLPGYRDPTHLLLIPERISTEAPMPIWWLCDGTALRSGPVDQLEDRHFGIVEAWGSNPHRSNEPTAPINWVGI